MLAKLRRMMHKDQGFTLIELLIVIIILGILAAIVVFGVATFRDDANAKACKADKKSVDIASQAYYAKEGAYAASEATLVAQKYLKTTPTHSYGTGVNFTYSSTTGDTTGTGACV